MASFLEALEAAWLLPVLAPPFPLTTAALLVVAPASSKFGSLLVFSLLSLLLVLPQALASSRMEDRREAVLEELMVSSDLAAFKNPVP